MLAFRTERKGKDGKKSIGVIRKTGTWHVHHVFFVYFFLLLYDCNVPLFICADKRFCCLSSCLLFSGSKQNEERGTTIANTIMNSGQKT